MLGSTGAWAQCPDNFNFFAIPARAVCARAELAPLGTGSSLSAFISTINSVNTAFLTNTTAFVSAPGEAQSDQQGGGVWGRVIAGTVDTNTTSTGTIGHFWVSVAQTPSIGQTDLQYDHSSGLCGLPVRP